MPGLRTTGLPTTSRLCPIHPPAHRLRVLAVVCGIVISCVALSGAQREMRGPAGTGRFGATLTVLPNGNLVVTDPSYGVAGATNVGAVFLYDGVTLELVSQLTGSAAYDRVGENGIIVLRNGNFLIRSVSWNASRGAVTWASGATGVSGVVSAANSIVGGAVSDQIGWGSVRELANGHYVVNSPQWGGTRGAVTWGNGVTGTAGVVSEVNSLVGTAVDNRVGYGGIRLLPNGNYVVLSPDFDVGPNGDAGAVTWGSGLTGVMGVVSAANSLVGTGPGDRVGAGGVTVLSNSHYVVSSPNWGGWTFREPGAVTWGHGGTGVKGQVSAANSLVGSADYENLGSGGVYALHDGAYVVCSPWWSNGRGAATWANGATGRSGAVSSANSLVGGTDGDAVGSHGVVALPGGHYVVRSANWNGSRGAVTWGAGGSGVVGPVSSANSLVGSRASDAIGSGSVLALPGGNYVVVAPAWDNGAAVDAGAVAWGSGVAGSRGVLSSANSLVGTRSGDQVASGGVTILANGNFVVSSPAWDSATDADAGAVTWVSGSTGMAGAVSEANSLVGNGLQDQVGSGGVAVLSSGHYVVRSATWSGARGAVTWGNGAGGTVGRVTAANSLVGSKAGDSVGSGGVFDLGNGRMVVNSPEWANGDFPRAGAVTWAEHETGLMGLVSAANSLVGTRNSDLVGGWGLTVLTNGHYVVASRYWGYGAVTWVDGTTGLTGPVTEQNSLVGVQLGDAIGGGGVAGTVDGHYVVRSPSWKNGMLSGAVSLGDGRRGMRGYIGASNSVLGSVSAGGENLGYAYDDRHARLYVGDSRGDRAVVFAYPPLLRFRLNERPATFPFAYQLVRAPAGATLESAVYVAPHGAHDPAPVLVDPLTGGLAVSSVDWPGRSGEFVLLYTNDSVRDLELRLAAPGVGQRATNTVAAYPVARPGSALHAALSTTSRIVTNRAGWSEGSRWYVHDCLVQGFASGEWMDVSVESDEFDPYLEILDLRTEDVLASNNDGWEPGTGARVQWLAQDGPGRVVRVSSQVPNAVGNFSVRVRPILSPGRRVTGTLGAEDRLKPGTARRVDEYSLDLRSWPDAREFAVFLKWPGDVPAEVGSFVATTGARVSSETLPGGSTHFYWSTFTNGMADPYGIEVIGNGAGLPVDYEVAVFPTIRPGTMVNAALTESDPFSTNRTATAGSGRWYYDDYFLRGIGAGERVMVQLTGSGFVPFLELRLLDANAASGDWPNYREGLTVLHTSPPVPGTSLGARDVVIRVTSGSSGVWGEYALRVDRYVASEIWSFRPASGSPGSWITVRGTNFIDGLQPLFDGVTVGGIGVASRGLKDMGAWQEFELRVEPGAKTGPITLWRNQQIVAVSTNEFVVLAPIGGVRRESGGRISFGVSNAVVELQNIVEHTPTLAAPIRWTPLTTNFVIAPGVWRYTNASPGSTGEGYYQIRVR